MVQVYLRATPHPPYELRTYRISLPWEARDIALPVGGVTGEGHNPERLPGPICAPPRAGHASGPGGGEPPPPALPQIQYTCSLEVSEQEEPGRGNVQQGGREETQAAEVVDVAGKHISGLPGLQETSGDGDSI